ncbi:hypothetical protein ACQB60_44745 [Actinomycetota bacterium Odt1-20B]
MSLPAAPPVTLVPEPSAVPAAKTVRVARERLNGAEAALIIAVLALAVVLTATGRPHTDTLLILGGAGLLGITLVKIAGGGVVRVLRLMVRSQPDTDR